MVGDVDFFIEEEKSFGVDGPIWGWRLELCKCDGVRVE